jgi:hypothetical protein
MAHEEVEIQKTGAEERILEVDKASNIGSGKRRE